MRRMLPLACFSALAVSAHAEDVRLPEKASPILCPNVSYSEMCYLDVDAGVITPSCSPGLSQYVQVISSANGMVVEVDMQGWDKLQVGTRIQNPQGYVMHIGNSPSNNAWGGDSGHFSNDSEVHVYNESVYVYGNDNIGSGLMHSQGGAIPQGLPYVWATVCDSYFNWYAWDPISNQGSNFTITDATGLFQIDGNEFDQNPNGNDTKLYLGFERTVANGSRTGSDIVVAPSGDGGEGIDVQLILSR